VLLAFKHAHVFWPIHWDKTIRDLHALLAMVPAIGPKGEWVRTLACPILHSDTHLLEMLLTVVCNCATVAQIDAFQAARSAETNAIHGGEPGAHVDLNMRNEDFLDQVRFSAPCWRGSLRECRSTQRTVHLASESQLRCVFHQSREPRSVVSTVRAGQFRRRRADCAAR
jgi:hypothetical protein